MVNFKIIGKAEKVSKEEIRCMVHAQATIMEFHNKKPIHPIKENTIMVKLVDGFEGNVVGKSKREGIEIKKNLPFKKMFTVSCHEVIHQYNNFPDGEREKLTTTLNARLNPTVAEIYNILIDGVYKRAGYFAHTKISYKPKGKDYYDQSEWDIVEVSKNGRKYRRFE